MVCCWLSWLVWMVLVILVDLLDCYLVFGRWYLCCCILCSGFCECGEFVLWFYVSLCVGLWWWVYVWVLWLLELRFWLGGFKIVMVFGLLIGFWSLGLSWYILWFVVIVLLILRYSCDLWLSRVWIWLLLVVVWGWLLMIWLLRWWCVIVGVSWCWMMSWRIGLLIFLRSWWGEILLLNLLILILYVLLIVNRLWFWLDCKWLIWWVLFLVWLCWDG